MVTTLRAGNTELILNPDQGGWCQLQLRIKDQVLQLGADMQNIIAQRLCHALEDVIEGSPAGSIQGIDVVGVLSLFERHCSVYVGQYDTRRVLFFQGEDGSLTARVELVSSERYAWLNELKTLRARRMM